jgi:hypothetical protein
MADFRQQFGLDFLRTPAASSPRASDTALPQGLSDAVIAYSGKVLGALNAESSQTLGLFDIARRLSTRVETLLPVMRLLAERGYVERISEDPIGDDTFRLTAPGKKVASI